jgi:hypothetical protein
VKRLLCSALLLLAGGCQPRYDGLDVELYSTPPRPVDVSDRGFEVPAGIAVVIDVAPRSDARIEYYEDDEVELYAEDEDVLRVDPTEKSRRFALIGVKPGETCVWVEVLGEREECIPATVAAATP